MSEPSLTPLPVPIDAGLAATLGYLSQQFQMIGAQILDLASRQDVIRDRLGGINEQSREADAGLRDRLDEVERIIAELQPMVGTTNKVLSELRPMIEMQLQHAGRVAEGVRRDFSDMAARYQHSLGEVSTDFEERLERERTERGEEVGKLHTELESVQKQLRETRRDELDLTKTRITSRTTIIVAAISAMVGGIVAIIVALVSRGVP